MKNSLKYLLIPKDFNIACPPTLKNSINPEAVLKMETERKVSKGHVCPGCLQQPIIEQLLARKMELEEECLLLEKEIGTKQAKLNQLQEGITLVQSHHQATVANKLAAGLAHEIRNPLTTIKGFIQLIRQELHSTGKKELAEVALDEINRANELISDFLSVFKNTMTNKTTLSLNKLIAQLKNLYSSEASLKEISMCVHTLEEDLMVFGNEKQLKQVIMNLLQNAFDAIADSATQNGEIMIETDKDEEWAIISIIDNGPGIDPAAETKLFTPFFTTKEKGTGIGLVISKQIVEEHGGVLVAESSGGHTKFSIRLPLIT